VPYSVPLITGAYGGHTIDFRHLAAEGVRLLGHVRKAHSGSLDLAPDLGVSLAHGNAAYIGFLDMADAQIERLRLNIPRTKLPDPRDLIEPLQRLNLRAAGIGTVIWATGYGFDFSWINVPVRDARAGLSIDTA